MSKKSSGKPYNQLKDEEKGVQAIKNQVMESFQDGVIDDRLKNNRSIHTYNNQSK